MFGPQGLPLIKPPYGRITAIDLNSGDHVWMAPNGEAPDWIRNHPALKGVDLPRTGRYEHAGLMVTRTLLFAGEGSGLFAVPPGSGGPMFRAHDKKTGEIISEFKLPANQSGIPMTYLANGRQYIVVAVGAVATPAEFVALSVD
jgi:quinoprotein glucose dehydrogenase